MFLISLKYTAALVAVVKKTPLEPSILEEYTVKYTASNKPK